MIYKQESAAGIAPQDSHVHRLLGAASHVRDVEAQLRLLVAAIEGTPPEEPRCMPSASTAGVPSFICALNLAPTEIHEACDSASKTVQHIRNLLLLH